MNPVEFRNTLGNFATGVTVITVNNENKFVGLTVNSFSSLSLDPAQILFCIDKGSSSLPDIKKGVPFVVNILQMEQEKTSRNFAKKDTDKFEGVSYNLSAYNVPVLKDNLATIHCHVNELFESGDHYIVVGDVNEFTSDSKKTPLVFYQGKFNSLKEHSHN